MHTSERIRRTCYLLSGLYSFTLSLTQPVWVLRLTDAGYDLTTVSLFAVVHSLTALVLEVPTGVLADRFGRRFSVLLSFALAAVGCSLWALPASVPVMLVGTFLSGAGMAFYSGALSAWAVDAILAAGGGLSTTDLFGRASGISRVTAMAGGFLSGTVLVRFGMASPWTVATLSYLLLYGLAWRHMTERWERMAGRSAVDEWRGMLASVATVAREGRRNRVLGLLLLGPLPAFIGGAAAVSQWQVKFQGLTPGEVGVTGVVWAFMLAASAVASFAIPWLVRAAGSQQRFLAGAVVLNSLAIAGAGLSGQFWLALPFFCLHVAAATNFGTVGSAAISDRVPSSVRATALSVYSMIDCVADVVGVSLFAQVTTRLSMEVSWVAAAALVLVAAPLMLGVGAKGRQVGLAEETL